MTDTMKAGFLAQRDQPGRVVCRSPLGGVSSAVTGSAPSPSCPERVPFGPFSCRALTPRQETPSSEIMSMRALVVLWPIILWIIPCACDYRRGALSVVAGGPLGWLASRMPRWKRVGMDVQSCDEVGQDRFTARPLGRARGRVLPPRPSGFAHLCCVAG